MGKYKATIGYVSPPRQQAAIELGEFEAVSGEAAHAKAQELAAERELQGTVQVRTA